MLACATLVPEGVFGSCRCQYYRTFDVLRRNALNYPPDILLTREAVRLCASWA